MRKVSLVFALMLGASVFLTACNDEEYVDEPIYDESVSESGGYIEDAGSESDKYIEDNEPVKIEESVDSAEDFGNGAVNMGMSTQMRSVRRGNTITRYGSSEELSLWSGVCVSPYYLSFVDRQNQSSVAGAGDTYDTYDDNQWFDDDGSWTWGWLFDDDDDYWNYLDDYEQTGESPYITFTSEPQLDENGTFWFELDEDGNYNAADVYAMIYMLSPDGEDIIELGETYDINGDWESGVFYDDFDGYWLSLPDGQNLATYIVEAAEDYTIYTSQILLNGEVTNLRLKLDYSEAGIVIEGAWDGIDEHGAASREITKLKGGDEIIPLYNAYALESDDELTYYGEEYIVSGEPEIYYDLLYDGDYYYCFCIDDIYGDYYLTDIASFYVEGDEVGFYVEE